MAHRDLVSCFFSLPSFPAPDCLDCLAVKGIWQLSQTRCAVYTTRNHEKDRRIRKEGERRLNAKLCSRFHLCTNLREGVWKLTTSVAGEGKKKLNCQKVDSFKASPCRRSALMMRMETLKFHITSLLCRTSMNANHSPPQINAYCRDAP